jgi:hypothetical protein
VERSAHLRLASKDRAVLDRRGAFALSAGAMRACQLARRATKKSLFEQPAATFSSVHSEIVVGDLNTISCD